MSRLEQYRQLMATYDLGDMPEFVEKKIAAREALEAARQELNEVPNIHLNGSADEIKHEYKVRAEALALRQGANQINYQQLANQLDQGLNSALDVLATRLIRSVKSKVENDLKSLDDEAVERLMMLVNSLPNDHQNGLVPATSRLAALIKVDESEHSAIVSASVQELNKSIMADPQKALRVVHEGNLPFVSLEFVGSLDELEQRRLALAGHLNS